MTKMMSTWRQRPGSQGGFTVNASRGASLHESPGQRQQGRHASGVASSARLGRRVQCACGRSDLFWTCAAQDQTNPCSMFVQTRIQFLVGFRGCGGSFKTGKTPQGPEPLNLTHCPLIFHQILDCSSKLFQVWILSDQVTGLFEVPFASVTTIV